MVGVSCFYPLKESKIGHYRFPLLYADMEGILQTKMKFYFFIHFMHINYGASGNRVG